MSVEPSKCPGSKSSAVTSFVGIPLPCDFAEPVPSGALAVPASGEASPPQAEPDSARNTAATTEMARTRSMSGPPDQRMCQLYETQVQRRDHEQVQERRCDQPTEDDEPHRILDLLARDLSPDHEGDQGQSRGEGGHQDRGEPLARTTSNELGPERFPLVFLQVLIMADHHDAVPGHDPQHREKPNERAQRDDSATEERRQH